MVIKIGLIDTTKKPLNQNRMILNPTTAVLAWKAIYYVTKYS